MDDKIPISDEDLIALIEQRPVIWDRSVENYRNNVATRNAWREIHLIIYPDYESWSAEKKKEYEKRTIKIWTRIRDQFLSSERRIKRLKKLERRIRLHRPHVYHQKLLFLIKPQNEDFSDDDSDDEDAITYLRDQDNSENSNDSQVQPNTSDVIRKKISTGSIEAKMIRSVDSVSPKPEPVNRHVSFFNGLLPTLEQFNDDQIIDFQLGVMQLVKSIKRPIQCEVILPAEPAQDLLPGKVEIE